MVVSYFAMRVDKALLRFAAAFSIPFYLTLIAFYTFSIISQTFAQRRVNLLKSSTYTKLISNKKYTNIFFNMQ